MFELHKTDPIDDLCRALAKHLHNLELENGDQDSVHPSAIAHETRELMASRNALRECIVSLLAGK
jgi:hypothetical protein